MKIKNYESESYLRLHACLMFLNQFQLFRRFDIWLCDTPFMDVRMWWHGFWVRPDPDHPSMTFDDATYLWLKKINIWIVVTPSSYERKFFRRLFAHKKLFPPKARREERLTVRFDPDENTGHCRSPSRFFHEDLFPLYGDKVHLHLAGFYPLEKV